MRWILAFTILFLISRSAHGTEDLACPAQKYTVILQCKDDLHDTDILKLQILKHEGTYVLSNSNISPGILPGEKRITCRYRPQVWKSIYIVDGKKQEVKSIDQIAKMLLNLKNEALFLASVANYPLSPEIAVDYFTDGSQSSDELKVFVYLGLDRVFNGNQNFLYNSFASNIANTRIFDEGIQNTTASNYITGSRCRISVNGI
jgi:hypothetical protein